MMSDRWGIAITARPSWAALGVFPVEDHSTPQKRWYGVTQRTRQVHRAFAAVHRA